jgi:pimeloyl-ACP methyl ester carboxylesterase
MAVLTTQREDVSFDSGGQRIAAWLYLPTGPSPSADDSPSAPAPAVPCVVLAHGFGATRAARLGAFAERFAAAGYAAVVFDYRHFGDSTGEPRQLLSIGRQQDDWRAAIAFARSLAAVDAERVVAWGSSFSGGHVAVIAAEDDRLAAVVSQNPFIDGLATLRALGPANAVRLTVAGIRDEWSRVRGRPPFMIPIVARPGETGAMCSPDALPGYGAMFEVGEPWINAVTARVALVVGLYRPIRRAGSVGCPWLVQVSDRDVITPPGAAVKAAGRAPRSTVVHYDAGHFDVYVGAGFDRSVADQLAFLERVVPAR